MLRSSLIDGMMEINSTCQNLIIRRRRANPLTILYVSGIPVTGQILATITTELLLMVSANCHALANPCETFSLISTYISEHDRRDRADHPHGIIDHNAPSTTQRKRLSLSNHPWPTSAESITAAPNRHGEYPNQKQHTLPTRKSRAITTDLPHVTTITLTDGAGSLGRANGNAFGSSHRPDKLALDNTRRPNYRSDGEQSNQGIRTAPSPRVETVLPSSFSNVNLLKRVNDRYKLTERLLIQLKIIAVLHAFFGFAMFSLDSSHAVVLWPYVEDSSERLYLCLRTFYSVGVVLIGCLSIAISCGKRSVLLDIVKVFCVVLLTTLLVAPSQTTLFRSKKLMGHHSLSLHHLVSYGTAVSRNKPPNDQNRDLPSSRLSPYHILSTENQRLPKALSKTPNSF